MSEVAVKGTDPGPLARLADLTSEANAGATMSVIAQRVADGEQLKEIAEAWGIPRGRLAEWITADAARAEQYARASRIWVDSEARRVLKIADDAGDKLEVAKARVQIDARFKLARALNPEQYGETSKMNVRVQDERVLDHEAELLEVGRGLAFVLAQAARVQQEKDSRKLITGPVEDAVPVPPAPSGAGVPDAAADAESTSGDNPPSAAQRAASFFQAPVAPPSEDEII